MRDQSRPAATRLKLRVLDAPQRVLWAELGATPAQFTLYGGTALALQLGHRRSIDFDFFSAAPFDARELLDTVPYLAGASVTQLAAGTMTANVNRGGDVKLSFFTPVRALAHIGQAVESRRPRVRIASKIDIAATKLAVLAMWRAAKDYLDIHALITKGRIWLADQLAAVPFVFDDPQYNPFLPLKALAYFGDGDLPSLPENVKEDLIRAVAEVEIADVRRRMASARDNPDYWRRS